MKQIRMILIAVLVLTALGFASGQVSAKKFSYTSGIQVQNLFNDVNTIVVRYFDEQPGSNSGGAEATSATIPMDALSSATIFPIHASFGFHGSVVISAPQPVASIVNLVSSVGSTHTGDASYIGMSNGGTTVSLPLLHKNNFGYDSWFTVQNAGSGDASVTVAYSDGTSAGPIVIKQSASYVFDQGNESHTPKAFAATITSTQPIVAVVVEEYDKGTGANYGTLAYNGFSKSETNALMPLVNVNNFGYSTGIQLQNTGGSTSDITVTYTPATDASGPIGTKCTETHRVAPGSSATYALTAWATFATTATDTTTCVKGQRFVGSAQITANSQGVTVNAIVNQVTASSGGAYGSFAPTDATAKVVLPLVADRNYGWYSGFNLMNVGTVPVTVNCVFTKTSYSITKSLQPGEAMNDVQNGKIADKYAGSGTCTATSASGTPQITAVVNQVSPNANDNLTVYEGINIQ